MVQQVCLLLITFYITTCSGQGNKTLVGLAVLFRHGDRSPIMSFPTDQYVNEKYFPEGLGQLLKKGKQRQYDLGNFLRQRYDEFLPRVYSNKDIYVVSSDVDRTIMSASANLAGLYFPTNEEIFQDGLLWSPIPIHTIPKEYDNMILMYTVTCPAFDKEFASLNDHNNQLQRLQYPDFYKNLSILTGIPETDLSLFFIHEVFYVFKQHNVSYLPPGYETIDEELLDYLAGLEISRETDNTHLQRLRAGPFFNYLFSWFDAIFEKNKTKLLMISGHDSTVVAALNSMGAYDIHPPDFTATVIWELYKYENGSNFVNVFYLRNTSAELHPIVVRDCHFNCDYDEFKRIMKPILIDSNSWPKECGL